MRTSDCGGVTDDDTGDEVGVTADVLRGAVHDCGRAYLERSEQDGSREGVVDEQRHAVVASNACDDLDVRHPAQRVGDRLHQHQPGAADRATHRLEVRHVDEVGLIPGGFEVLTDQREGASVQLARGQDCDRLRRQRQDRHMQRRHPGRGGDAGLRALQLGHRLLQHRAVAVGVSAVVMPGAVSAGDGVVVIEVGVHVHRRRAQVRRERTPGNQFAAGVYRPRCLFHGRLEPCA